MTEKEMQDKLDEMRKGLRWVDTMVHHDFDKDDACYITERQAQLVRDMFDLFQSLNWQVRFNNYKELRFENDSPAVDTRTAGEPVRVRPCGKEYEDKTFFGILIGDVPLSVSHKIDDQGIVTATRSMYNPAIFVPELNKIIYGMESWWGEIKSEEELNKLITDELIDNVWYVKLLKGMYND